MPVKFMFGALIRAAGRWRGLRLTEFELRQLATVRKELDDDIEFRSRRRRGHPNPLFQQIRALTKQESGNFFKVWHFSNILTPCFQQTCALTKQESGDFFSVCHFSNSFRLQFVL